ncbi:hypothetical protein OROMI_011178 [Orobanche minor]
MVEVFGEIFLRPSPVPFTCLCFYVLFFSSTVLSASAARALLRLSLGFIIILWRIENSSLDQFYSTSQPFKSRRATV